MFKPACTKNPPKNLCMCPPTQTPTLTVRQRRDVLLMLCFTTVTFACVSCLSPAARHSSKITLRLHYSLSELGSFCVLEIFVSGYVLSHILSLVRSLFHSCFALSSSLALSAFLHSFPLIWLIFCHQYCKSHLPGQANVLNHIVYISLLGCKS